MAISQHIALKLKNLNLFTYFLYILLQLLFFSLNTSASRYRRQYLAQNPEVYSSFSSDQFPQPSPTAQRQQVTAYNEQYARMLLYLAAGAYSPTPPNGCEKRQRKKAFLEKIFLRNFL